MFLSTAVALATLISPPIKDSLQMTLIGPGPAPKIAPPPEYIVSFEPVQMSSMGGHPKQGQDVHMDGMILKSKDDFSAQITTMMNKHTVVPEIDFTLVHSDMQKMQRTTTVTHIHNVTFHSMQLISTPKGQQERVRIHFINLTKDKPDVEAIPQEVK